ncbi:MAG TPA: hypothetical protein VFR41_09180 [Acidimicrobiia bacterium]|nr:hypothetical protein [Acidimicrobiia bacterium]
MDQGLGTPLLPAYLRSEEPEVARCSRCGARPAVPVRFGRVSGLLLIFRKHTIRAMLCCDCGIDMGNEISRKSFATGWWGVVAPFVNVAVLIGNYREVRRLRTLELDT